MGQQQLILLVLATVIVGIAIVVGIRAFTENDARANADAMMQDAVHMANDIQAAVKKPQPFGGVAVIDSVSFGAIGYPNTNNIYTNVNGSFELSTATAGEVLITGEGGDNGAGSHAQEVQVRVCGLTDQDIKGAITLVGGQGTGTTAAPGC